MVNLVETSFEGCGERHTRAVSPERSSNTVGNHAACAKGKGLEWEEHREREMGGGDNT
jgi:hypothetical protein